MLLDILETERPAAVRQTFFSKFPDENASTEGPNGPLLGQTLEGSFEGLYRSQILQVNMRFESSRRDLHKALLCTAQGTFANLAEKTIANVGKKICQTGHTIVS